jgi:hypothetical protein
MSSGSRRQQATVRSKFWMEAGLAAAAAAFAVATLMWHDWIETLFGVQPDGGGGELEWLLTAALAVLAVGFALAARVEFRRTAASLAAD